MSKKLVAVVVAGVLGVVLAIRALSVRLPSRVEELLNDLENRKLRIERILRWSDSGKVDADARDLLVEMDRILNQMPLICQVLCISPDEQDRLAMIKSFMVEMREKGYDLSGLPAHI